MKLFSTRHRPVHLGPFPLERVKRCRKPVNYSYIAPMESMLFSDENPASAVNAMSKYQAMLDLLRDGTVKKEKGELPSSRSERSHHMKAFGYYQDASQVGICELSKVHHLDNKILNPDVESLKAELRDVQPSSLAIGMDAVLADLRESFDTKLGPIENHTHAIVFLQEYPRDPGQSEAGCDWIRDSQPQRACVRAAETAVVIANYIRLLGYEARVHTGTTSGVDLNKVAVAAGLAVSVSHEGVLRLQNPFLGTDFGLSVITTTFELEPDIPLERPERQGGKGLKWWIGAGSERSVHNIRPYHNRPFKNGAYPFEKIKRVDVPTTFIDEQRIPRVPKRADMFARAIFGDLGKHVQDAAKNGNFLRKSAASFSQRKPLAALTLIQKAPPKCDPLMGTEDETKNADNIKALGYFLGADAIGVSRCPDWVYYSHDASGNEINPYHENAISLVIDQGFETMEGASGDDWIASSQSMRAYLRFSLLGGIIAEQIRNLGYEARVHSAMDGEVLQPPLLLLSGLGEVSRIGEVILNPYLGPRLKSGVITTNMPLKHDLPIDFGLQSFCNNCNKCARECPSGAITAGPKTMFNGYEIWKSDSQKCTQYRITQAAGSMCGRCMKTCPWNLEGLFAEAPFRWAASNLPGMAKALAKLDDKLGNGGMNPIKKWWWDLEMVDEGPYTLSKNGVSERDLQTSLKLKHEDQTLAVYPANLAPPPYQFPAPMDREKGIQAYKDMLSPKEHQERVAAGETKNLVPQYEYTKGESPVIQVKVAKVEIQTDDVSAYDFVALDGSTLPKFEAGAHIDVVVAPEFFRQYSLAGDPNDRSKYRIGVLKEAKGRGGSRLLHQTFKEGRRVFISRPINHFPLVEDAKHILLMGGGIGITPMIAMAHQLYALGRSFAVHYSCAKRESAGFIDELSDAPWADRVTLHISAEGNRADLVKIFETYEQGYHVYTCGPDRYMSAVLSTAAETGWPEDVVHKEYFSSPETPVYENHPFKIRLENSGQVINVSAEQSATDALSAAGIHVEVKCGDGLCGVCQCDLIDGDVEHRDFVLSNAQREKKIILCQSRASKRDATIVLDMS